MIRLSPEPSFLEAASLSANVVKRLEEEIGLAFRDQYDGVITISAVSDQEIRRLNRMYRSKDSVTDVLSFSYLADPRGRGDTLGDVVISLDQAKRQAEAGDVQLEIIDLMTHGVLHVLGMDHETAEDAEEMFPLQDRIVNVLL